MINNNALKIHNTYLKQLNRFVSLRIWRAYEMYCLFVFIHIWIYFYESIIILMYYLVFHSSKYVYFIKISCETIPMEILLRHLFVNLRHKILEFLVRYHFKTYLVYICCKFREGCRRCPLRHHPTWCDCHHQYRYQPTTCASILLSCFHCRSWGKMIEL